MRVMQFVKSLLPDMEKRRVVSTLQSIKEELSEITIPVYVQALKTYSGTNFKNKEVKDFDTFMKRNLPNYRRNHLNTILISLKNASETVESLITVFNNHKEDKIYKDGMTLLMANQLQYSQLASFIATYARRWLLYLFSLENAVVNESSDYMTTGEYRREKEYLDKDKQNFTSGITVLSKTYSEVDKVFKTMPDIVIDPDSPIDPSITMGGSKVDPMQFGLVPTYFHLIYQLRMAYTNWQLKRHTLMVEEKQQLELKILLLKESIENKNDPKLEKQIEFSENRVEKLRFEIERLEESVND